MKNLKIFKTIFFLVIILSNLNINNLKLFHYSNTIWMSNYKESLFQVKNYIFQNIWLENNYTHIYYKIETKIFLSIKVL